MCSPVATPAKTAEGLIAPHGGKLINLMLEDSKKAAAVASCNKTMECTHRNACDVELLTVG
jgi:sulfate adenylyltransferase